MKQRSNGVGGRILGTRSRSMLLFQFLVAVLILVTADSWVLFSEGFASSSPSSSFPSSSSSPEPSPWAPSSWLLTLEFGRPSSSSSSSSSQASSNEDSAPSGLFTDSSPFSSYGASGSRLVVTCPVVVEAEDDTTNKKFPDTFVGNGASVIRARGEEDDEDDEKEHDTDGNAEKKNRRSNRAHFTYITMDGAKTMDFSPGGWTLRFPPGGKSNKGRASKLRFYLDLTTDLSRNDVVLPAGTRLYFAANAWREGDYEAGLTAVLPLKGALEAAQRTLEENLSHSTGDRRLDGNDPLETIKAYGDMTALVLDRDRCKAALRSALDRGYPGSDDHPEGPWPGTTEWLTISEDNPIYARVPRTPKKSATNVLKQLLGGETEYDYGKVGTWSGEAISSLLLDDE